MLSLCGVPVYRSCLPCMYCFSVIMLNSCFICKVFPCASEHSDMGWVQMCSKLRTEYLFQHAHAHIHIPAVHSTTQTKGAHERRSQGTYQTETGEQDLTDFIPAFLYFQYTHVILNQCWWSAYVQLLWLWSHTVCSAPALSFILLTPNSFVLHTLHPCSIILKLGYLSSDPNVP